MSDKNPNLQASTRRANIGANVLLQVVLAAVVLVMVNYLSMRHYRTFDLTEQQIYTLSEQTRNVLRELPRQVDVIVMMSQGDALFARTQEMLNKYREHAGDQLQVRYIDPDQNPTEFQHVLERYPVNAGLTQDQQIVVEQVIIVAAGESNRFVTPNEEFVSSDAHNMMDMSAASGFNPPRAELAMTSAIYRVVSGRQRVICMTSGHGEWSVDRGERSLGDFSEYLERYEVELRTVAVSLEGRPSFEECDAVVVAGPRRPFMPDEAAHLQRYVEEEGGDLVLFLDPIVERERFVATGLEGLARRFGVVVENDEVVDPQATASFCGGGHPTAFIAAAQEQPVCLVRSRSLQVLEDEREGRAFIETISEDAFAEVNASQLSAPARDGDDRRGPLTVGAAVEQRNKAIRTARIERRRAEIEAEIPEDEQRGSLVVVMGDSDFLDRELRQNARMGNFGLAVQLFNSVADNRVLVAQPPREVERTQLTLTDAQLATSRLIFVFVLPLIGVAIGMSMWWTRRR